MDNKESFNNDIPNDDSYMTEEELNRRKQGDMRLKSRCKIHITSLGVTLLALILIIEICMSCLYVSTGAYIYIDAYYVFIQRIRILYVIATLFVYIQPYLIYLRCQGKDPIVDFLHFIIRHKILVAATMVAIEILIIHVTGSMYYFALIPTFCFLFTSALSIIDAIMYKGIQRYVEIYGEDKTIDLVCLSIVYFVITVFYIIILYV